MENKFRLLLKRREGPTAMRQQNYSADDRLDVRDLTTGVIQHVRARDLSPYCHTLVLDGQEYHVLNVIRT